DRPALDGGRAGVRLLRSPPAGRPGGGPGPPAGGSGAGGGGRRRGARGPTRGPRGRRVRPGRRPRRAHRGPRRPRRTARRREERQLPSAYPPGVPSLLVTNDFPPKVGGIQSYLWELWRRLPPGEVTVLTTPYPGAAEFDRAQPFRVVRDRGCSWRLPPPLSGG